VLQYIGVLILVMNCIPFSSFFGVCIDCQHMHLMNNIKIIIAFMQKLRADWTQECLLSFSPETCIFLFAIQKYENLNKQNYNFVCCM